MLDRYILRYRYCRIVVLAVIYIFAYHNLAYSNPLDDLLIFPGIESRQMSTQIKSNPYNPELYYKLGQAYANRGWDKKTAQYISKWLQLSKSGIVNDGTNTFVLDEKNDKLLVLNSRNNKLIKKIDLGWLPKCLIPTPDKKHLYVPNALSNTVSTINTESLLLEKNIKVGKLPWNGKISPDGDQVYVTNLKSDDISVINTKTNSVIENIDVGNGPWGVAVSPNGKRLYVSNQESRNIQVVDTGNYNIIDVIALEIVPGEIALAPDDEKKLYALNSSITGENLEIYVLDLSENKVANSMKVPGEADQFLSKINAESIIKQIRESKKNIPIPEIVDSKYDTKFQKSSLNEYKPMFRTFK
ncbi:beta-propeller fold lactonase family protein [Candidatus Poribacteria bacterium]|nr:beta-propeller fold lactonase family protein [Candidatus Poribacteria bacterium]